MEPDGHHATLKRPVAVAVAAFLLVLVTVSLGAALGLLTQRQFDEIRESWVDYSQGAERKGILLSEIRGQLGYGGIIHNFKNYVLRQEDVYRDRTEALMAEFERVAAQFEALDLSTEERVALGTIIATIREYEANLPLAVAAVDRGRTVMETDTLVRVDDTAAIAALAELEQSWASEQQLSSARLLGAVGQGQTLIWIGFLSILALVLAALAVGWLLYMLVRDLRGAVKDLGEELRERKRLERSEGRLATAVEQSPATILITDTDARIQYTNKKFTDVTGWTLDDIRGQTPAFLQSGETSQKVYQQIREGLARGEAWHGVFRNRKKDGSSYWAETTILPLVSPEGEIQNYIGISEDITENRRAREQVVRAQKLEAVGQLAGGVAHDFNNILTTIVGSAHLAAMDAPEKSDLEGEIKQIDIAARRAQSLIRGLLTFARREPGEKRSVNIGTMIDEVLGLLRASIPPVIALRHVPPDGPVFVLGDQTHLHQIIMNLCRNAAEAMAGQAGEIVVTARHCDPPEEKTEVAHGWVCLTVSDDGPGMSGDTQVHLFEPFFTTKPIGKGSGLGLSVVYGLVDEMGGRITVDSEIGRGSTFTILLPAALASDEPEAPGRGELARGNERVILIDDEAEVVGTFRRLLLRLGYQVEAFTSPVVALERFRTDPARFDIVISDMVMPDMSGEELVRALRDLRPDIPVIFCSAYKPGRVVLPGPAPEMLDKPVQPALLAQEIRAQLDRVEKAPA
ncbi:MAG: PAS domain S-box protein [Alphaproteobacteria bacterium]|nr:PAS domain S-box protein [Alphaproteobacteria bacterium]